MILYRKAPQLRLRRSVAPEPPFWGATTVSPYGPRRAEPLAIDYLALRAAAAERSEVAVCEDVAGELDRARQLAEPLFIDAAESAETVFRRGEQTLAWCAAHGIGTTLLASTLGSLPRHRHGDEIVAIAAWPPDLGRLTGMFGEARERGLHWGVVVPVVYPVTTELPLLTAVADAAADAGASFLGAFGIELEATARQAIAQELILAPDDDRYTMLFHARPDVLQTSTERHVAALAAERGMNDFVPPPRWEASRSNWNAAVLLTLVASRMLAMELDLDLAGLVARSARAIAELDKPVGLIAGSASLSIIGSIDAVSAEMLGEWLDRGNASFAEHVAEEWRLFRTRSTEHGTRTTDTTR